MTTQPPHASSSSRVVVESVSSGRLIALLVAAVGLSIVASLLVSRNASTATPDEVAGTEAAAAPADTDAANASDGGASGGGADDVLPAMVDRADLELAPEAEVNVAVAPEIPPPSGRTAPAVIEVEFEVVENVSTIDEATGTRFETWGYRIVDGEDGLVVGTPGPVIRGRVGDVLRFTITNPAGNAMPHNIDLHAVTGQGGGAEATTVAPGETATIEARLLYPGFFMYHCAYGDVPSHITHGMYGGILVDPETPLPEVDHEWYMVQSEYYTTGDGDAVTEDRAAVRSEDPSHVVFNGAVGALAGDNALQMEVGQRARIYFVNAGLNLTSNFHPIGSHWDRVYQEAALLNEPLRGSQTTLVPAGGGTVVEMIGQVPQTVVLVDHALARAFDKGAIGQVVISGEENPEIFNGEPGDAPTAGDDAPVTQDPTATDGTPPAGASPTPSEPAGEVTDPSVEGTPVSIEAGAFNFRDVAPDDYSDAALGGYDPGVLEVKVGDTVTWTNDDNTVHTATSVDGSFDSGFIQPGGTWSYTFTEAGEFNYFCTPHPWMRARVVVAG